MADEQSEEFFSFDEALDELRLKEEELKRLVSEGEIRAFRDGETMKLRVSDVESLRSELSGGEVVDLGGSAEELVFEDDSDLDDAGMATEEISELDTLLDDDVEDVGEIELDEIEELDEDVAPVRRQSALESMEEEEHEGTAMRALMILTTVLLVMGIPVWIAVSNGAVNELAKGISGIFGAKFE